MVCACTLLPVLGRRFLSLIACGASGATAATAAWCVLMLLGFQVACRSAAACSVLLWCGVRWMLVQLVGTSVRAFADGVLF